MREYQFIKYEGCGNDYIYIDCFGYEPPDEEKSRIAVKLSDRHFGVGGDGVVFICRSDKADGFMRMFNADGSEGKMCGNAIRCVGKYLYDKRGVKKEEVTVETLSGVKTLKLFVLNGAVTSARVDMGAPVLSPKKIPALFTGERTVGKKVILDKERVITLVSMGNPHCVIFTEGVNDMDIETPGKAIENHKLFPDRINTEFVEVISSDKAVMRVWERGSGETLACGTGACAAAVAMVLNGIAEKGKDITIELRGGQLVINYDKTVYMTGPATEVFTGSVKI